MITSLTSWSDDNLIISANAFIKEKHESEILGSLRYTHWIWVKVAISVSGSLALSKQNYNVNWKHGKKMTFLTTTYWKVNRDLITFLEIKLNEKSE